MYGYPGSFWGPGLDQAGMRCSDEVGSGRHGLPTCDLLSCEVPGVWGSRPSTQLPVVRRRRDIHVLRFGEGTGFDPLNVCPDPPSRTRVVPSVTVSSSSPPPSPVRTSPSFVFVPLVHPPVPVRPRTVQSYRHQSVPRQDPPSTPTTSRSQPTSTPVLPPTGTVQRVHGSGRVLVSSGPYGLGTPSVPSLGRPGLLRLGPPVSGRRMRRDVGDTVVLGSV